MRKDTLVPVLGLLAVLVLPLSAFAQSQSAEARWEAPHHPTKIEWLAVQLHVNGKAACEAAEVKVELAGAMQGWLNYHITGPAEKLEAAYRECAERIFEEIRMEAFVMKLPPPGVQLTVTGPRTSADTSLYKRFRCRPKVLSKKEFWTIQRPAVPFGQVCEDKSPREPQHPATPGVR